MLKNREQINKHIMQTGTALKELFSMQTENQGNINEKDLKLQIKKELQQEISNNTGNAQSLIELQEKKKQMS